MSDPLHHRTSALAAIASRHPSPRGDVVVDALRAVPWLGGRTPAWVVSSAAGLFDGRGLPGIPSSDPGLPRAIEAAPLLLVAAARVGSADRLALTVQLGDGTVLLDRLAQVAARCLDMTLTGFERLVVAHGPGLSGPTRCRWQYLVEAGLLVASEPVVMPEVQAAYAIGLRAAARIASLVPEDRWPGPDVYALDAASTRLAMSCAERFASSQASAALVIRGETAVPLPVVSAGLVHLLTAGVFDGGGEHDRHRRDRVVGWTEALVTPFGLRSIVAAGRAAHSLEPERAHLYETWTAADALARRGVWDLAQRLAATFCSTVHRSQGFPPSVDVRSGAAEPGVDPLAAAAAYACKRAHQPFRRPVSWA